MLNLKYLEAFIRAADAGSFHKAAEAMYITPSALIKQINMLEEEADVPLFERTPRGLKLTKAGESLYQDGRLLLSDADNALRRARRINDANDQIIRVGTTPVSPADTITRFWETIYEKWPQVKIQIVPFANSSQAVSDLFRHFGREIDVICGVADPVHLKYRGCDGIVLEQVPINAAVSLRHPFRKRETLRPSDLSDQEVMIMREGHMEEMDLIRKELVSLYPDIRIHDFDMYDMDTFNYAEETGAVLLISEKWMKAHPAMKMIPMEWDHCLPYGILYSLFPDEKVRRFISCLKD